MNTLEIVFDAMEKAGKPVKGGEVAESTGLDKKEVDKAIKKLAAEGKIHSPVRCFYAVVK